MYGRGQEGREFSARGFTRDTSPDAPICRWILGTVKVDLMPTSEAIINVVEGRRAIEEEIGAAATELRAYLVARFAEVIAAADFANTLPGLVAYDELHGQRVAAVMKRIEVIAALTSKVRHEPPRLH